MAIYNTLNNRTLRDGYAIEIDAIGDTKYVTFYHGDKEYEVPFCFGADNFSDADILKDRDIIELFTKRYGKHTLL